MKVASLADLLHETAELRTRPQGSARHADKAERLVAGHAALQ
jgi:hypothetical protein